MILAGRTETRAERTIAPLDPGAIAIVRPSFANRDVTIVERCCKNVYVVPRGSRAARNGNTSGRSCVASDTSRTNLIVIIF